MGVEIRADSGSCMDSLGDREARETMTDSWPRRPRVGIPEFCHFFLSNSNLKKHVSRFSDADGHCVESFKTNSEEKKIWKSRRIKWIWSCPHSYFFRMLWWPLKRKKWPNPWRHWEPWKNDVQQLFHGRHHSPVFSPWNQSCGDRIIWLGPYFRM